MAMGELPTGWVTSSIDRVFNFKYGKGLPHEKRNTKGSVKVYGSNGVVGFHDDSITTGPTIIIGRKGSVGEVNFSSNGCWPVAGCSIEAFDSFNSGATKKMKKITDIPKSDRPREKLLLKGPEALSEGTDKNEKGEHETNDYQA